MKKQQVIFTNHSENRSLSDGDAPDVEEPAIPHKISAATQREIEDHTRKFEALVNKSERVLLKISAVFPFDLFPDTVVIDENKLSIIHREFFFSPTILSFTIYDINDVVVESSIFFATLRLLPNGYGENWVQVKYLKKKEAIEAKRIVAGLRVGIKEGVDITKVQTPDLARKIAIMGAIN